MRMNYGLRLIKKGNTEPYKRSCNEIQKNEYSSKQNIYKNDVKRVDEENWYHGETQYQTPLEITSGEHLAGDGWIERAQTPMVIFGLLGTIFILGFFVGRTSASQSHSVSPRSANTRPQTPSKAQKDQPKKQKKPATSQSQNTRQKQTKKAPQASPTHKPSKDLNAVVVLTGSTGTKAPKTRSRQNTAKQQKRGRCLTLQPGQALWHLLHALHLPKKRPFLRLLKSKGVSFKRLRPHKTELCLQRMGKKRVNVRLSYIDKGKRKRYHLRWNGRWQ